MRPHRLPVYLRCTFPGNQKVAKLLEFAAPLRRRAAAQTVTACVRAGRKPIPPDTTAYYRPPSRQQRAGQVEQRCACRQRPAPPRPPNDLTLPPDRSTQPSKAKACDVVSKERGRAAHTAPTADTKGASAIPRIVANRRATAQLSREPGPQHRPGNGRTQKPTSPRPFA
jgi:hypothetical protein